MLARMTRSAAPPTPQPPGEIWRRPQQRAFPNAATLAVGSAKHGLQRRDVTLVNLFKGARIEADGTITRWSAHTSRPNHDPARRDGRDRRYRQLPPRARPRDEWTVTPLRVSAWHGAVTPETDPIRNATPEGLRAFLNVEDYFRR